MKKFFARLFAPQYQQVVRLNDGRMVEMISSAPFTVDDVANHLRPTPKVNKFRQALPWILVAILTIGLAVSGYYNWSQHQTVLEWEQYCETLRNDYNEYLSQYEDNNDDLRGQIYQLQEDREDLLAELNQMSDLLTTINNDVEQINSTGYSLWYDSYYNDTAPDTDDLEDLAQDTSDLGDYLEKVISDLDNYIYNFGW